MSKQKYPKQSKSGPGEKPPTEGQPTRQRYNMASEGVGKVGKGKKKK